LKLLSKFPFVKGASVHFKKIKIDSSLKEPFCLFCKKYFFKFFIAGLVGISILVSYYFLEKSYFYTWIPQNNNYFVHVKTQKLESAIHASPDSFRNIYSQLQTIKQNSFDFSFLPQIIELGIPYITFTSQKDNQSVFFIEKVSQSKAKKFLELFQSHSDDIIFKKEGDISKIAIVSGKEIYCIWKKWTLFCSKEEASLDPFINKEFQDGAIIKKILQNVSSRSFIQWSMNASMLELPLFQIYKDVFPSIAGAITFKNNFQVFFDIRTDYQNNEIKQKNILPQYFSKDNLLFFVGGHNLKQSWMRTQAYYQEKNSEYSQLIQSMLTKKTKEVFGTKIDFNRDVLPLFEKEYALALNFLDNEKTISQKKYENIYMSFISKIDTNNMKNINNILQSLAVKNKLMFSNKESQDSFGDFKEMSQDHMVSIEKNIYKVEYLNQVLLFMQKDDILYVSQSEDRLKVMINKQNKEGLSFFSHSANEFGFINKFLLTTLSSFAPQDLISKDSFQEINDIQWESHVYENGLQVFFDIY
jgi:hypothetical protein